MRYIPFGWETEILKGHVVNPTSIQLYLLALGEFRGKIDPDQGNANRAHLIIDMTSCIFRHSTIEDIVCPQIKQMLRNAISGTHIHQESVLAVFDLQGNTASARSDNGFTLVDCL